MEINSLEALVDTLHLARGTSREHVEALNLYGGREGIVSGSHCTTTTQRIIVENVRCHGFPSAKGPVKPCYFRNTG